MNDYLVIQHCGLCRAFSAAQVNLFTINSDENLPRLAVLRHTTVEGAPVAVAEPAMVDLAGAHKNQIVHSNIFGWICEVGEHFQSVALLLGAVVGLNRLVQTLGHTRGPLTEHLPALLHGLDRCGVVVVDLILLLVYLLILFVNGNKVVRIGLSLPAARVHFEHGSLTTAQKLAKVANIPLAGQLDDFDRLRLSLDLFLGQWCEA